MRSYALPLRASRCWLLIALAMPLSVGCSGPRASSTPPACEPEGPSYARAPLEVDELLELGGDLPELIGGLGSVQRNLDMPRGFRTGGRQMRVVTAFVVDEAGCPRDLRVVESPAEVLSQASVEAIRQARFRPGTLDGTPVPVRMVMPTTFRSNN